MKKHIIIGSAAMFALSALPAFTCAAQDASAPQHVKSTFDAKVDSWAEGTLMAIDADGGSITVRGVKRPYATAYASMLREMREKTDGLTAETRQRKIEDIREKWRPTLEKAQKEPAASKESDFTFYLPKEIDRVCYLDETPFYDRENKNAGAGTGMTAYERNALTTFKDLRVGERVTVGYEAGIVYHTAFVIIKIRGASSDASAAPADKGQPNPAVPSEQASRKALGADVDTENARKIRQKLTETKELSASARDVRIEAENGMVTLHGKVRSEAEKEKVEGKAADVVGKDHLVSKLEVSAK
ncbi:MAG: BON domain-containing protein [Planctomycetota bacterium]|nr:BON domain-containing protein [Planctomycetota bacterium]